MFVDHDDAVTREVGKLQGERPGIGEERMVPRLVQQVDDVGVRERLSSPGALAHAAHAEEEEAALRWRQNARIRSIHHVVILLCKMTT